MQYKDRVEQRKSQIALEQWRASIKSLEVNNRGSPLLINKTINQSRMKKVAHPLKEVVATWEKWLVVLGSVDNGKRI